MKNSSETTVPPAVTLSTDLRASLRRALARELNLTVDRLAAKEPQPKVAAPAPAPTEFLSSMSLETWCCVVAHAYAHSIANTGNRTGDPLAAQR